MAAVPAVLGRRKEKSTPAGMPSIKHRKHLLFSIPLIFHHMSDHTPPPPDLAVSRSTTRRTQSTSPSPSSPLSDHSSQSPPPRRNWGQYFESPFKNNSLGNKCRFIGGLILVFIIYWRYSKIIKEPLLLDERAVRLLQIVDAMVSLPNHAQGSCENGEYEDD